MKSGLKRFTHSYVFCFEKSKQSAFAMATTKYLW